MPKNREEPSKWEDQATFTGTKVTVSFSCSLRSGDKEPLCVVTKVNGASKTQEEKVKPFIGKTVGKLARRFKIEGSTVKPIEFYQKLRREPRPDEKPLEM